MKISFLFFLFLFSISLSLAGALYDFGTMQEGSYFQAEPGETITLNLYFYVDEEYGNRITHVLVTEDEIPEGWTVEFDPPAHEEQLNVSGILTTSYENLYVEPKPVLPEIPEDPEEDVYYLASPSGLGYLQAKKLEIHVTIPETGELGESYELKFTGEGFWFGESGTIALKQTRPFTYTIQLVQKEYSEQIISSEDVESGEEEEEPEETESSEDTTTYLIGGLLVVVVALVAYILLSKRPKKRRR